MTSVGERRERFMARTPTPVRVGLISDTHGLLRPEALAALRGADCIVHAGDIGRADLLDALAAIAPVFAVRGNNDQGTWADAIPATRDLDIGGIPMHLLHDLQALEPDAAAQSRVIIAGHSHRPLIREDAGLLVINPGSAGPRRFRLPVSVGWLLIDVGNVSAEIVELDV